MTAEGSTLAEWWGVFGVVIVGLAWLAVQRAWLRCFPDAFDDPDPLAGRTSCGTCGCTTPCVRSPRDRTSDHSPHQEEAP